MLVAEDWPAFELLSELELEVEYRILPADEEPL